MLWQASVLRRSAGFSLALTSKDQPKLRLGRIALHSRDDHVELSDLACRKRPGVSILSTQFRPLTGSEGGGNESAVMTVFRSRLRRSPPSTPGRRSSSTSTAAIVTPPSRNRTQPKYVVSAISLMLVLLTRSPKKVVVSPTKTQHRFQTALQKRGRQSRGFLLETSVPATCTTRSMGYGVMSLEGVYGQVLIRKDLEQI